MQKRIESFSQNLKQKQFTNPQLQSLSTQGIDLITNRLDESKEDQRNNIKSASPRQRIAPNQEIVFITIDDNNYLKKKFNTRQVSPKTMTIKKKAKTKNVTLKWDTTFYPPSDFDSIKVK